jgi:hypothetical protein
LRHLWRARVSLEKADTRSYNKQVEAPPLHSTKYHVLQVAYKLTAFCVAFQVHGMQVHGKRKLYMILFYAGLQPFLIWWMTSHLIMDVVEIPGV